MFYLFGISLFLMCLFLQVNSLCKVTNVTTEGVTETSITLSWSGQDCVTDGAYHVTVEDTSPPDDGQALVAISTSVTVWDLKPCTVYNVSVAENGSSVRTGITAKTLPDSVKVWDLEIKNVNSTSAYCSWKPPARDKCYGKLNKYSVQLEYEQGNKAIFNLITEKGFIELGSLELCTRYKISVRVLSAGVVSKQEVSTVFQTLPDMHISVKDLIVYNITSRSAVVTWAPVIGDRCYGDRHIYNVSVEYVPRKAASPNWIWMRDSNRVLLVDAQPSTSYKVSVTVISPKTSRPRNETAVTFQTLSELTTSTESKESETTTHPISSGRNASEVIPGTNIHRKNTLNISRIINNNAFNSSEEQDFGTDSTLSAHNVAIVAILVPVGCVLVVLTTVCLLLRHKFRCFSESRSADLSTTT